jgi:hypothetical protein
MVKEATRSKVPFLQTNIENQEKAKNQQCQDSVKQEKIYSNQPNAEK